MKEHEKGIEITMAIIFGLLFLAIGLEHLGVFWQRRTLRFAAEFTFSRRSWVQ
jgi:hypothetical protein